MQVSITLYKVKESNEFSRNMAVVFSKRAFAVICTIVCSVLSVRFEVGVSLLLAPAGPFPLVGYAEIKPAIRKRVLAGAPAGAGSY